jgi:hypothetical protein
VYKVTCGGSAVVMLYSEGGGGVKALFDEPDWRVFSLIQWGKVYVFGTNPSINTSTRRMPRENIGPGP